MSIFLVSFNYKREMVYNESRFVKADTIEEAVQEVYKIYPNARVLSAVYKGRLLN